MTRMIICGDPKPLMDFLRLRRLRRLRRTTEDLVGLNKNKIVFIICFLCMLHTHSEL